MGEAITFKTIGIIKRGVLFVRMPKEAEKLGYVEGDWLAVTGIPPYGQKVYSTTHIFEASKEDPEIARDLEKLLKKRIEEVVDEPSELKKIMS